MTMVRLLMAVAASRNYVLHQMNVQNAFLNGDLEEKFYMKVPPGFSISQPGLVCKLHKSLYGLHKAPWCWFAKVISSLFHYGFTKSRSDYSLFTHNVGSDFLAVLVYVDDLIT